MDEPIIDYNDPTSPAHEALWVRHREHAYEVGLAPRGTLPNWNEIPLAKRMGIIEDNRRHAKMMHQLEHALPARKGKVRKKRRAR